MRTLTALLSLAAALLIALGCGVEAGGGSGVIAQPDAGVDAGTDGGGDAGTDAGTDGGVDGGPLAVSDIRDLQTGKVPAGTPIRLSEAVVTAIHQLVTGTVMFVQDPSGTAPFSGLEVRISAAVAQGPQLPAEGDLVTVQGTVVEDGQSATTGTRTTLTLVNAVIIDGTAAVPAPAVVSASDLVYSGESGVSEQWEGVLVMAQNAAVASVDPQGNTFTLQGGLVVENVLYRFAPPQPGDLFQSITGPMSFEAGATRLLPRRAEDLVRAPPPPRDMSVTITHVDTGHDLLAVAPDGTAYGKSNDDSESVVYASTDSARTWRRVGERTAGGRVMRMTALSDGVLLADVQTAAGSVLARSADRGATWTDVKTLAPYRTLSPHSFDELDGVVYYAEYQDFTQADTPVRLWASADRGLTWSIRSTFTGHTHAHAVRVEPGTGALWVFLGDKGTQPALVRSLDGGTTWETMLTGESQARVVDAVFTPAGLLYGLDVSPPLLSGVLLLAPGGAVTRLANLPGPSYSMHQLRAGGFFCGTTREPKDVYPPPGEENAYIFGSLDGTHWNEVARFPRLKPDEYAQADVYWELPTGEAVIHLFSVEAMYQGYELATVNR